MADALVEQERMRKELDLAREIQLDLLPDESDTTNFPVKGMNVPALEVSGDFYDFFKRDDGLIYFNLADVSGKSMNAAMLMAKASGLLHHLARSIDEPGELLARVNDEIYETVSHGMFVTIVSGFIDHNNGTIKFSNAGHQPPLFHHKSGEFEELKASALPLGILPETEFPVSTIHLEGGALYIFTEGVTGSVDEDQKLLHVAGLIKLIEDTCQISASKRLQDIVAKIRHPNVGQRDDITLMVNEACMNVMQHAYDEDEQGEIMLNNDGKLHFRLVDYAKPIDLSLVKPCVLDDLRPGGLGTHFINEIMDECDMGHLEEGKGNYLEMIKKIS